MKLADYVIRTIAAQGIDKCFLVYGSAIGDLVDAFTRTPGIEHICPIHEQGCGYMAEGWSKVTGKTGFAMATSGPGMMNLVTPCGNAFYDSVPMLYVTGNVKTQYMRTSPDIRQIGFQEADPVAIFSSITKYAVQVRDPARIRYELEKCLFLCRDGRHGPCLLDLPIDVQQAEIDPDALVPFDARPHWADNPMTDFHGVDSFVRRYLGDLEQAQRPVMLIGGGVRSAGAVDIWRSVASKLQIPCYPTWNAVDAVTSDFPWYAGRVGTYGGSGRNFGIQNADLLLVVGSRLSGRITGGRPNTFARMARKYLVEIDDGLLKRDNQQVPFDVTLKADAKLFLHRLDHFAQQDSFPHYASWTMRCLGWRDKYDPVGGHDIVADGKTDPYRFLRELSNLAPDNAIIVSDCGGQQVTMAHSWETKHGQRWFTNNSNSPMGFSFCGAIGAWFADPSRPVICVIGDGGLQVNIQELQSMKHYGCKVKTFIINNHVYGITKAFQAVNFGGREIACGPDGYSVPSFSDVVMAYGIASSRIDGPEFNLQLLEEILDADHAVICDVDCGDYHRYEPKIVGWSSGIEDMHPLLPRDEFRANMIIDPLPGWETRT